MQVSRLHYLNTVKVPLSTVTLYLLNRRFNGALTFRRIGGLFLQVERGENGRRISRNVSALK